jgi:hypothetical protein
MLQAAKQGWVQYLTRPLSKSQYKFISEGFVFIYKTTFPTFLLEDGFQWTKRTELPGGFHLQDNTKMGQQSSTRTLRRKVVGYCDPQENEVTWYIVSYEGFAGAKPKRPSQHNLLSKTYLPCESWIPAAEGAVLGFIEFQQR